MTGVHDQLTATCLRDALERHPFITEIIYRACVSSTNDLAKERAGEGALDGLLVIADEQTAGRGRMGRRWWAPAGSALLTSLLFRPTTPRQPNASSSASTNTNGLHIVQQFMMLCALAAADAVTDLTALNVDLKWPNDLIVRGRKLAGLLAESIFEGNHLDSVIVGLGLNVNTGFSGAPRLIAPATSLRLELGHPVNRLPLLVSYLDGVARRYAQFKGGKSPYNEWVSRLATLGQHITVHVSEQAKLSKSTSRHLAGVAQGVDIDGALLLRTADGTVHRLLAADISLGKKNSN
jgi:BirA family biotin operon repressor/biotin-[acetyl-CoA-carboxylase] ligase